MRRAARWEIPSPDSQPIAQLARSLGIQAPAARVLWNRGYRDADAARRFLSPTLDDLFDPMRLRDMDVAVERLHRAITGREKILLYGDYDVDGTMSVVILKKTIELAGGTAGFHVPHRLREGYGMRPEVVEQAAAEGVTLIVSVDTGVRASEVVRHARQLNIDCIITDHHLPEEELPPALAVLNPNRTDCLYPEKNLCGAGVTFKLIQALLARCGWSQERVRKVCESLLKLVAIATVADVVPLTGENRVIVKRGLEGLADVRNSGLRALLDRAGFKDGEAPSAGQIAFRVAPRINAAGRMDNAADVVELFLTSDGARAGELADRLQLLNDDRRSVEQDITQIILSSAWRNRWVTISLDWCLAAPTGTAGWWGLWPAA
jgi:single-stranded-DNA-specific exonuclease